MAKIAVLDDTIAHAEMAAAPLKEAGFEVKCAVHEIDWNCLVDFGPDLLVFCLYRKNEAFDRPIREPSTDILGFDALLQAEEHPAIQCIPIVLTGYGLREPDVPTTVHYDLFLSFPKDSAVYVDKSRELTKKVKTRRKLSGYVCPNPGCGSRLMFFKAPAKDLFCPKCGSSVAITDGHAVWLDPDGHQHLLSVEDIEARPKQTSSEHEKRPATENRSGACSAQERT